MALQKVWGPRRSFFPVGLCMLVQGGGGVFLKAYRFVQGGMGYLKNNVSGPLQIIAMFYNLSRLILGSLNFSVDLFLQNFDWNQFALAKKTPKITKNCHILAFFFTKMNFVRINFRDSKALTFSRGLNFTKMAKNRENHKN